jgi:hypothetical protein
VLGVVVARAGLDAHAGDAVEAGGDDVVIPAADVEVARRVAEVDEDVLAVAVAAEQREVVEAVAIEIADGEELAAGDEEVGRQRRAIVRAAVLRVDRRVELRVGAGVGAAVAIVTAAEVRLGEAAAGGKDDDRGERRDPRVGQNGGVS